MATTVGSVGGTDEYLGQERTERSERRSSLLVLAADGAALLGAVVLLGAGTWTGALVWAAALVALRGIPLTPSPTLADHLPRLVARGAVGLLLVPTLLPAPALAWGRAPLAIGLVLASRGLAYPLVRRLRRLHHAGLRVAIAGDGPVSARLAEQLLEQPEHGLVPVGLVHAADDGDGRLLPVLGRTEELAELVTRHRLDGVVAAYGAWSEPELVGAIRRVTTPGFRVWVLPRLFELGAPLGDLLDVRGLPLVPLHQSALVHPRLPLKRVLDIVVAAVALALAAPAMLALAAVVRLSSPGPVIFRQERVGRHGKPFELLKFRSMRVNDDADTTWSVVGDSRVTPVGRFMRRTHLDELPQLWNVLRGDMSLVGPRPERAAFVDRFAREVPWYDDRHRVRGGLTGRSQVEGLVGDTSIAARAALDNAYIENWSVWRDLVILARTPRTMLTKEPR